MNLGVQFKRKKKKGLSGIATHNLYRDENKNLVIENILELVKFTIMLK